MFTQKRSRLIVVSLVLLVITAITVSANWGSRIGLAFGLADASENTAGIAALEKKSDGRDDVFDSSSIIPATAPRDEAADRPSIVLNYDPKEIYGTARPSAGLTGTKNIPGDYADLAAAIADLNANGVGAGGVTLNVVASNPQTAPVGGYIIGGAGSLVLTTTNATDTVTITGNNNTVTASAGQAAGSIVDAVFKLVGADYVKIQGFTMQEDASNTVTTVASNNMTEWGVALLYVTQTDGATHNTIQNNTISLNKIYANTFGVYSNTRHTSTDALTLADVTAASGANSSNKVYGNAISNVNHGIVFIGSATAANMDDANDIGGSSLSTGNNGTNYGGLGAASAYVGFPTTIVDGAYLLNQTNFNLSYNSFVTSLNTAVALRGILTDYSVAPTGTVVDNVTNNTVTFNQAGAGGMQAITTAGVAAANVTMNLNNNKFINSAVTGAASAVTMFGIANLGQFGTLNMNNNEVSGNTSTATTGGFIGITNQGAVINTVNILNNNVGTEASGAVTFSAAGTSTGQACSGITNTQGTATTTLNIDGNFIRGISMVGGSGQMAGVFNSSASVGVAINMTNNHIGTATANSFSFSAAHSGAFFGLVNAAGAATATLTMSGNDVTRYVQTVAGSGSHNYINNQVFTGSVNMNNNTITNLTANTTGSVTMLGNNVSRAANTTVNVNNNSIVTAYNKTGAGGTILFYNSFGVSPTTVTENYSGNNFSNMTFTGATTITGWRAADGSGASAPVVNMTNNSFNNITGGTSGVTIITLGFGVTATSLNTVTGNTISNVTGGGAVTGVTTAQNVINLARNKIYGLQTNGSALVAGVTVSGSNSTRIYNNLIGDLRAPSASIATDAIRGINITSTTASSTVGVYFNSIYLNATSSGANFSTSGVFHTYSATATTAALDMRNNAIVNKSTANGTGLTTAFRRSAATDLNNYATTSDRNAFYAGTPGASNLIYFDGTNSDQTLGAFQTRVTPREAASVTEDPPFLSTAGSSPDFLHLSSPASALSNGGSPVTSPVSISDDYDGDFRNITTPDIGADEFGAAGATPTSTSTATATNTATQTNTSTPTPTPGCGSGTFSYTGPAVNIPDNTAGGVNITIPVTGLGTVNDLNFRVDGTQSATVGSTTPGITHSWVGDLKITVVAPGGQGSVVVFDKPVSSPTPSGSCSNNNLAELLLDDDGGFPAVQAQCNTTGTTTNNAYPTGSFSPANALSAFDGINPNGDWTINISDAAGSDTGAVRGVSLIIDGGCGTATATNTATATATNTPAVSPTSTNTATATNTATNTPTPGCGSGTFSYTGPITPIPDNTVAGVSFTVPVTGLGVVNDVNFRFDGTQDNLPPATTVAGVGHSWVGDVKVTVTAPGGQGSVVVFDQPGVPASTFGCSNNNIAQLTLDDDGGFPAIENSCDSVGTAFPTGNFSPNNALSAFDGINPNGDWVVTFSDNAGGDTGDVHAFSLVIDGGCGTATATATSTATAAGTFTNTATPTNTATATSTATFTPTPSPTATCEVVQDTGFEAGSPWTAWTVQTSTNFGSPMCNVAGCGTGGGTAPPYGGTNWAWFGGVSAAETATLGQSVVIPSGGSATLSYYMFIGSVTAPFDATLVVSIDGTPVASYTEPATAEAGYTVRTVDVSAYANGASHALLFTYVNPSGSGNSNFSVDDVSIVGCGATPTATNTATPANTATFTPSSTNTATATATATSTPSGGGSIAGTIIYGNVVAPATPPRFVKNVTVASTVGSPAVTFLTGTNGQYTLTGFGAGSYTIRPTKPSGPNSAITSADAARTAQGVVGSPAFLNQNQRFSADVNSSGSVTSNDAANIARFAAGLSANPGTFVGNWKFFVTGAPSPLPTPPQTYNDSRSYASVSGALTGEDYIGLLLGEVSGNYNTGTNPRPAPGPERMTSVAAPRLVTPADSEVTIPVSVLGAMGKDITSYQFDLRYDPTVIQPQTDAVELAGSVSRGLNAVANTNEPGLLRVVMYGVYPIDQNGLLLNLKFTAVGAPGTVSPITFENMMFNEGDPGVYVTDGQVELSASAPNQAEMTGRLLGSMGQGIPNARVTLTDTLGETRTAISNGFGMYRFGNLTVGQTYTLSVDSRSMAFTPMTVSVTGQSTNVDMVAAE